MIATMMDVPLSLNHLLDRAGTLFASNTLVSRLPDKSLRTHTYGEWHKRTRALAAALTGLGLQRGERVATLCWNHHAHLEAYFGIPAAGGVMHTLNLRLAPDEIGWIAADAKDRFLIVDDVLLPLYKQFAHLHAFEKVIVFPFSGAPVASEFSDYEALLNSADADGFRYPEHGENDPVAMCYTSGTTGRPKGVAYSHRSTVLHTLVGALPDHWGLHATDSVLPVTPMFHANSWGIPYGAVMLGIKLVFPGPHLHPDDLLVGSSLARSLGQKLRVRVQARDVSLTLEHQHGTSILNILPVTVVETREDSPGQWMVALDAGGARLLARITQRSALALGVEPGRALFAQVKGVALLD